MKKTVSLLFWMTLGLSAFSQGISTQGKEFWLSFLQNGYYERVEQGGIEGVINQMIFSARETCHVTITNPNYPNWSEDFDVQAGVTTTRSIPDQYCYHLNEDNETVVNKGLRIVATDTISVYCANIANYSFDASFVLPIESLGNDYIIQCGEQSALTTVTDFKLLNQTSSFLIVAIEDNTVIDITPSTSTLGGHAAGETFQVTLNAGQTYQVRSNNTAEASGRDLSGSRVTTEECKKIAVFNGNTITRVPIDMPGDSGFEHIFEQALPIWSWGKKFVVTQSLNRDRDFVKIVSSADENHVRINGTQTYTLNANESAAFSITSSVPSCFIETEKISAVYLYNTCKEDDANSNSHGDPSMVYISPVEQFVNEVTFATFTHEHANILEHYVNIVVGKDDVNQVYLDESLLPDTYFSPVNGNADYRFARIMLEHGTHHLTCANGFSAHVYGFGVSKGYAYMAGSSTFDLSTNLSINGEVVATGDMLDLCMGDEIAFEAEINFDSPEVIWDFGDGSTSNELSNHHIYTEDGLYQVSFVATSVDACHDPSSDQITFFLNIHPTVNEPHTQEICWNGTPGLYNDEENGFVIEYDSVGTYHDTVYSQTPYGCLITKTLTLSVFENNITTKLDTVFVCYEDEPYYVWHGEPYVSDTIATYIDYSEECPHTYLLPIRFKKKPETISVNGQMCVSFYWDITDSTYYTLGTHYGIVEDPLYDGCEQVYELTLTLMESTEGETMVVDTCDFFLWYDSVYTASDFYTVTIYDETGCAIDQHLQLRLKHTPEPSDIQPIGNSTAPFVIPATEFQINAYEFTVSDSNPQCEWDSVGWHFCKRETLGGPLVECDSEINWRKIEKGALHDTCKIYVLSHIEDTIWLRAFAYNGCELEGVPTDYWLLCSFYDLDEHEAEPFGFNVVPNPNKGQMELHFDQLNGPADIKIYDMHGNLIDQLRNDNDIEHSTLSYSMSLHSGGIYFFVATTKEGAIARKVVIQR